MDVINKLKQIDFDSNNSDDVNNILSLKPILTMQSVVNRGIYIVRSRKGGHFTKRSQVTYCPASKCNSLQRATLAGNTMFYGVISDDQSHLENARAISISECSTLCREGINSIGREKFSISYWEVIEPLNVISFIADTTFPDIKDNILLNDLRKAFIHESNLLPEEDKKLFRFICSEFSKIVNSPKEYLISATIATTILNNNKNIDGIIYPSVQLGGQAGLNIALSPRSVNKKLYLTRIIDNTLYKNGEQAYIRMEKVIEYETKSEKEINDVSDDMIKEMLNIDSISSMKYS